MSDGWPGDELREEAGRLVDEATKYRQEATAATIRAVKAETELEAMRKDSGLALYHENNELKEDIRFLLSLIPSNPEKGYVYIGIALLVSIDRIEAIRTKVK